MSNRLYVFSKQPYHFVFSLETINFVVSARCFFFFFKLYFPRTHTVTFNLYQNMQYKEKGSYTFPIPFVDMGGHNMGGYLEGKI